MTKITTTIIMGERNYNKEIKERKGKVKTREEERGRGEWS